MSNSSNGESFSRIKMHRLANQLQRQTRRRVSTKLSELTVPTISIEKFNFSDATKIIEQAGLDSTPRYGVPNFNLMLFPIARPIIKIFEEMDTKADKLYEMKVWVHKYCEARVAHILQTLPQHDKCDCFIKTVNNRFETSIETMFNMFRQYNEIIPIFKQIIKNVENVPDTESLIYDDFKVAFTAIPKLNDFTISIRNTATDLTSRLSFAEEYVRMYGVVVKPRRFWKLIKDYDLIQNDYLKYQGSINEFIDELLSNNIVITHKISQNDDPNSEDNSDSENQFEEVSPNHGIDSVIDGDNNSQHDKQSNIALNKSINCRKCQRPEIPAIRGEFGKLTLSRFEYPLNEHFSQWWGLAHSALRFLDKYENVLVKTLSQDIQSTHDQLTKLMLVHDGVVEISDLNLDDPEDF